jgi:hypothetical protein
MYVLYSRYCTGHLRTLVGINRYSLWPGFAFGLVGIQTNKSKLSAMEALKKIPALCLESERIL